MSEEFHYSGMQRRIDRSGRRAMARSLRG